MTSAVVPAECRLCGVEAVEEIIGFGSHPIAHRLLDRPDQEEFTHPVRLGFCHHCGLAQLIDPIPPEQLYTHYHSLSAWKFNPHEAQLVQRIESLPGVDHGTRIVEVGSNDGSFLAALRSRGFTSVLGLEPARDAVAAAAKRGVETLNDYLTPALAARLASDRGPFGLLILRQVAEHIPGLPELADSLRALLAPGGDAIVEVPDFDFAQRAPDYGAIWEEHVNQFTSATLAWFLARAGIEVRDVHGVVFSGRIISAWGQRPAEPPDLPLPGDRLAPPVLAFRDHWPRFRLAFQQWLAKERSKGRRIALYGAGCRACCLVNYSGVAEHLELVVDDQPEKQGKYLPGARLPILPSTALTEQEIDLCLLAVNAENEDRAIARHDHYLSRGGEFVSIHPPSPRLPSFWTRLD